MMIRALTPPALFAAFSALAATALVGYRLSSGAEANLAGISGQAIMVAEHRALIQDVLAAYPPLPLLLSVPFAYLPPLGITAATLAAIMVAGLTAAVLYYRLRSEPVSLGVALPITLLVALSPVAIQAVAAGPGAALLMLGMLMLCFGLFGMSSDAAVPDMMMTAIALALMVFSHPFGIVLMLATLPALAITSPPALFARAPVSVFLILMFPALFGLASFAYTRWVLGLEPLTFIAAAVGAPDPGETGQPTHILPFMARICFWLAVAVPVVVAFLYWSRARVAHLRPAAALAGTLLLAAFLQVSFRGEADLPLILAMGLTLAAVCAIKAAREHRNAVLLLLCAGWAAGFFLPAAKPGPASVLGSAPPETAAAFARALCPLKGVMVDTRAHPQLARLCGTARGFVATGEIDFDIQIQSRRLTSPYVLVEDQGGGGAFDLIARTFPDLYRHGASGYALIYDRAGWRLYARLADLPMS